MGRVQPVLGLRRRRVASRGGAPPVRPPTRAGRRPCATGSRSTSRSPPSTPRPPARIVLASGGCRTAKVKVAEPGQSLADEIARLEAVRDALGPSGRDPRRRQRRLGRRHGGRPAARARPRRGRAGVRRAARARRSTTSPPCAAARTSRSPPTSRSAAPRTRCAVARAQAADIVVLKVAAPRRRACLPASSPSGSGCRSSSLGARDLRGDRGRGRARRRAARAALRVRPGHRAAVRPTTSSPTRSCRVDGAPRVRRPEPDPALLARCRRAATLTARWRRPVAVVEARA